jgi:hypothetical protein
MAAQCYVVHGDIPKDKSILTISMAKTEIENV